MLLIISGMIVVPGSTGNRWQIFRRALAER
jgi:hypothetical protein